MCAILDANVVHEVFGDNRPRAGIEFLDWIDKGRIPLVFGGKLLDELTVNIRFRVWLRQAVVSGRARVVNYARVSNKTETLRYLNECQSNDHHVLALAQISHARLLYSNDHKLIRDFKEKSIIDKPRGTVYSTDPHRKPMKHYRELLRKSHCRK